MTYNVLFVVSFMKNVYVPEHFYMTFDHESRTSWYYQNIYGTLTVVNVKSVILVNLKVLDNYIVFIVIRVIFRYDEK